MAEVVREVERKHAVAEGFALPDLVGVGGVTAASSPQRVVLRAAYYDTPDLRLAREGITLRRREGGSDAGWHLKLPASGGARDEVRLPLGAAGAAGPPPEELADLVTAFTRRAPLAPVAVLRTERTLQHLASPGGAALELALDDVAVEDPARAQEGRGGLVLSRFRELEVEDLERAADVDAAAVCAALVAAGAVPGDLVPKAVRALGPLAQAAPDVPRPEPVARSAPAADLVRAAAATQVRALRAADVGVRRGEDDAVHQLRVAARRLRSVLRALRPLLAREWADGLREELAWLAGEMGLARDGEVLAERLAVALGRLPAGVDAEGARALLLGAAAQEEVSAHEAALAALRSDRYAALLDRLVLAAALPEVTERAARPCAEVLPPLVARTWRRLAREVDDLTFEGHDDDWHAARKSAKRVRYTAEAVAPVLGGGARDFAKQVERVTELLGEHQDAAVAADQLLARAVAAHGAGPAVQFALGVLFAGQRQAVRTARAELIARVWPQVARGRHRRFLRA